MIRQTKCQHKPGSDVAVKQSRVTDTLRKAVTQRLQPVYVHAGQQENKTKQQQQRHSITQTPFCAAALHLNSNLLKAV